MMDSNVQPGDSGIITAVLREELLVDIAKDRHPTGEPPNTYKKGGLLTAEPCGENTSRIDIILANPSARTLSSTESVTFGIKLSPILLTTYQLMLFSTRMHFHLS